MSTLADATIGGPLAERDQFRRQGYAVVRRLIEPALADFLWSYVHTKFASQLLTSGGRGVPNSLGGYGDLAFDGLREYLRPRVEDQTGLTLHPTFSYFRFYKHGDFLKRHRDRPACEISLSLAIGQDPPEPWPIFVEGSSGAYQALLEPGDALIYRGVDLFHWRDVYPGKQLVQVFLFYVDRHGSHAGERFDKRKTLMRPREPARTTGTDTAKEQGA